MKILITGASGFVGRNIKRLLLKNNYEVLTPKRQELNVANEDSVLNYCSRNTYDGIVHCAFEGTFDYTTPDQFKHNIQMFENLVTIDRGLPTIIIGSGAEFDRRFPIQEMSDFNYKNRWPVDLYGLAKNLITRRCLELELENPYILRLFGCFGVDEQDFRFIRRSILRLRDGLPIEINNDREMDFFYIDDMFPYIDLIFKIQNKDLRNINMVYPNEDCDIKLSLSDIAKIICQKMEVPENIIINETSMDLPYTGYHTTFEFNYAFNLIGLERGIEQMITIMHGKNYEQDDLLY
jgi:nucleoside-diphosphate-sugar epimerase